MVRKGSLTRRQVQLIPDRKEIGTFLSHGKPNSFPTTANCDPLTIVTKAMNAKGVRSNAMVNRHVNDAAIYPWNASMHLTAVQTR